MASISPTQEIERVARQSYGRLVAFLAAKTGDLMLAEDALSEAFAAALKNWPTQGIPENAEAWLMTTAKRKIIDEQRRQRGLTTDHGVELLAAVVKEQEAEITQARIPDERLKLFFLCSHPAIDPAIRTPLTLQMVLGLDAATIAQAFLVAPKAMSQRLVRAKLKIRDAKIPIRDLEPDELPARLNSVLETIYAAYAIGCELPTGADNKHGNLAEEAIWLGRVLVELMPEAPEALGLLALMLYNQARSEARRSPSGDYVPLSEQDVSLWSRQLIDEAEQLLRRAYLSSAFGPYQLEAAIQSAHCQRAVVGETDWPAIERLYAGLVKIAPSVGAMVGYAAAIGQSHGPAQALAMLDSLTDKGIETYQPYWALRAHLLAEMSLTAEAQAAFQRAVGLTEDPAVRKYLLDRMRLS
ncbi:MAG: DUF6596 domain-containing protein [Bythopirellula sp.]|nr:DUF6596 domain-containing protein [Bythopirellula sp.]